MLPRSSSIRLSSHRIDAKVSRIVALLTAVLVYPGLATAADTQSAQPGAGSASIHLSDGSVIVGAVTEIRDDQLHIKTGFSDNDLVIDVRFVERLRWLERTELLMDDSRVVVVPAIVVQDGKVELPGQSVPLEAVDIMNPAGWEEGKGYHWTGDASTAIAFNRGNTETDEFDIKLNTVFTSKRDRFTANSHYERDDTYNRIETSDRITRQKVVTSDNWKVLGKYDFFLNDPRNYLGTNVSVEADALAGVELRTYAGPYFGRRLVDTNALRLDGEVGLSYVSTDYTDAVTQEDNHYTGVNWNITAEGNLFGDGVRLYLRHVGIVDASDTDQLILKNTLGAAFPLVYGLEGSAEMTINYDGTAAEGSEELDQVYSLRLGYAW